MEFIGLKIAGFVVWTLFAWYIGRKWEQYNSVSDIVAVYTNAQTSIKNEVAAIEARLAALKALIP